MTYRQLLQHLLTLTDQGLEDEAVVFNEDFGTMEKLVVAYAEQYDDYLEPGTLYFHTED
jgi:hypothetical protein